MYLCRPFLKFKKYYKKVQLFTQKCLTLFIHYRIIIV
nr:MAG TPA: hypothetical protein [Caudoviricetes sp.]